MRHMRIAMTLLAVALAFGSGCNKKNKDAGAGSGSAAATGSAGSGSATASGSGSAAGSGSGSDSAELQMAKAAGNCPSTVAGTTSKAEVSGKDLVLTITSDDKDSVAAIQKRTEEMIAVKTGAGAGSGTGHDARGSHGGKVGLCPAHVPEGATIKSATIANGVTITITPKDGVDALKTEVDARITKAADWVKANVKAGDDEGRRRRRQRERRHEPLGPGRRQGRRAQGGRLRLRLRRWQGWRQGHRRRRRRGYRRRRQRQR